ncbi:MAG TPA: non-heme iron oxygenase ferredoxin subunit [Actinomycetes bacterium]|jgi:3-phenylpropionate/trans-cinnamate dioxygenase ferredoxin subunit|nr:non-heme iron oxygenase ferredoxin subunit [Actinomycetes bacterium]
MAWVRLGSLAELEMDSGHRVELSDDEAVALIRTEDGVYALVDCCTHEDYPLSEGFVEDGRVECVLHGSCFDLATGHPDVPPAVAPVRTFPVKVDDDDVLVDLPERWAELAENL